MKNLPLIVGIALPIVFVLALVGFVYLPGTMLHPAHDFLYTTGLHNGDYAGPYQYDYVVKDGKIQTDPAAVAEGVKTVPDMPDLFRYDVQTGAATLLSYDDAAKLTLTPGPSSPDGFTVEYRYSNAGIFELFGGGGNDHGYVITKGGAGKRLNLPQNTWSGSMKVIGWVAD